MKCLACRKTLPADVKFCPDCGTKVSLDLATASPISDEPLLKESKYKASTTERKIVKFGIVALVVIVASSLLVNLGRQLSNTLDNPVSNSNQNQESNDSGSSETISQSNAVEKAKQYLIVSAFSKVGLVRQLEYEGFSAEDAEYAVNAIAVDWNEQAAKKAKQYLDVSAFSASGLIAQLVYEGFTDEQAAYGAQMVGF